jgi:hypothetical protein
MVRIITFILWILAMCRFVGRCQHFAETYYQHLQGLSGNAGKHNHFSLEDGDSMHL